MIAAGNRFVRWAHSARARLRAELGGRCVFCGSTDNLQFDHIHPATRFRVAREAGFVRSTTLYRRDYAAGLLQLLCDHCNRTKGAYVPEEQPF